MFMNFTEDVIKSIDERIQKAIKEVPGSTITMAEYMENYRAPINTLILQALFGAELKKKGDHYGAKFSHKLPTTNQMLQISNQLGDYIKNYEGKFLTQFKSNAPKDDMSIPPTAGGSITYEKDMTDKKLREKIVSPTEALTCYLIGPEDILPIAAMGKDARKKHNLTKGMIIGGITIVAASAIGVGGYMVYKRRQKQDEEIYEAAIADGDLPVLTDSVDVPVEADPPVVTID